MFLPPPWLYDPLIDSANSTFQFIIASAPTIHPVTGAKIPTTAIITIRAIAKPDDSENSPEDAFYAGGDRTIFKIKARAIDPIVLPPALKNLAKGKATIDDIKGEFTLRLYSQNPYIKTSSPNKFYGHFRPD